MEGNAGGGGKTTRARAENPAAVMKVLHEDGAKRVAEAVRHELASLGPRASRAR